MGSYYHSNNNNIGNIVISGDNNPSSINNDGGVKNKLGSNGRTRNSLRGNSNNKVKSKVTRCSNMNMKNNTKLNRVSKLCKK